MAISPVRLTDKTVFVHEVLSDVAQFEVVWASLSEVISQRVGNGVWLCTDAGGREGFYIWRDRGGRIVGDQYGVAAIFQHDLEDRFAELREGLDIGIRNDAEVVRSSGKFANVEFLKTTSGWFY